MDKSGFRGYKIASKCRDLRTFKHL